ncbi:GDCCVxC domain-containing (seleno)protein [Caldovatus sediminis]|nr:GDCCVxC domain-containing (seleno)protein [Caldovatus sediminis]
MILSSTITCPLCGHRRTETMPTDACRILYDCKGCGAALRPRAGDCCVFCSYGDTPCPPVQAEGACRPPAAAPQRGPGGGRPA